MINTSKYIIILLLFLILQVIWFNHMHLFGTYTPMVFVYPILILPIQKNESLYLVLAFLFGISIDLISNTGGLFAATALFVVYTRKIYFLISKNKSQDFENISIQNLNLLQKSIYYFTFILISQILLYLLESFNISLVLSKTGFILVNSFISLFFFIFIDLLFFNPLKK